MVFNEDEKWIWSSEYEQQLIQAFEHNSAPFQEMLITSFPNSSSPSNNSSSQSSSSSETPPSKYVRPHMMFLVLQFVRKSFYGLPVE